MNQTENNATTINRQKGILYIIAFLNAAIANTSLYAATHPQASRYLKRAYKALINALGSRSEITFFIVDDELVVDRQPMDSRTPHVAQWIQLLKKSAIERITFKADLSLSGLTHLVSDLASKESHTIPSQKGIILGKVQVRDASAAPSLHSELTPELEKQLAALGELRDRSLEQLKALYQQIKIQKKILVSGFDAIVQEFVSRVIGNVNPLHLLASLKSADEYTFTHAINVCLLTMAQAEALGIEGQKLHDIGVAAAMHDAGKMFIPDEILNKPGKLSEAEWVLIRHHAIRGARQVLRMEGIPKLAFIGALEHHIRFDGSGYPELKHWRPSIVSQMIAIADLFDAMRSRRPYQEPKPDAVIIDILKKESGTAFHPLLVENFLRVIQGPAVTNSAPSEKKRNRPKNQ